MKKLLTITALLLCSFLTMGQHLEARWDTAGIALGHRAVITLGDQLNLTLSVSSNELPSVVFPTKEELSRNDIEVLSQKIDTIKSDKGYTLTQTNIATSFEEGEHSTGLLSVQVMQGGTLLPCFTLDSLTLVVEDFPDVDTTKAEIKDIASIMKEPYTFWEIFRWILLGIVVAALVWLAVFLAKKIKKKEPIIVKPQAPPTPPNEQALSDLEKLRTRELWQAGLVKEYHTELTDIVRRYMGAQMGIDSTEMTSDQTLEAFEESPYKTNDSFDHLRRLFRTADMVKFAKAEPQPYEHDQSMKEAKSFVEETFAKVKEQQEKENQESKPTKE